MNALLLKNYLTITLERNDLPFQTRADIMERESLTLLKLTQHQVLKGVISLEKGELILEKHGLL